LSITPQTLLEAMLDPALRLGTSTPKADPSGDYAFDVFARADRIRSGARSALEAKALMLTGGLNAAAAPAGRNVYGWHVAEGRADIFLTYRTNALAARAQDFRLGIVDLPDTLAVGASYGLTVIEPPTDAAERLADFILSQQGRDILGHHGFAPPG
jgi:ABC-type molybdate transport system substrate-binding protein